MKKRSTLNIEVDDQGRFILPVEVGKRYGLAPGGKARLEEGLNGFRISRSSNSLARVYIEPTTLCNLDCATCMRNVWDEPPGQMSEAVFHRILEGIRTLQPTPSVFFGGFGEPLTHPHIIEMVAQAHQAGAKVELITNGILLTVETTRQLTGAGLHRIWVSIDGATPQGYADVRIGDALPEIIENLRSRQKQWYLNQEAPYLGIAIVAMKRNFAELPEIMRLGKNLGADQFSITNVYPHTPELRAEMLYSKSLYESELDSSHWAPLIDLPRMDINPASLDILEKVLFYRHVLSIARQEVELGMNTCPFVEKGSLSVRWDGAVSPCLALLHTHDAYLDDHIRRSHAYAVGSLKEKPLIDIWNDASYRALRERLVQFDFSPCTCCNSCEMAETNLEDCYGNLQPACGGCLWAQGFIQCP